MTKLIDATTEINDYCGELHKATAALNAAALRVGYGRQAAIRQYADELRRQFEAMPVEAIEFVHEAQLELPAGPVESRAANHDHDADGVGGYR